VHAGRFENLSRASICLTAAVTVRYISVRVARSCATKISEDDDVQIHTERVLLGVFFCTEKGKAG
jgi:hypothetical protein